MERKIIWGLFLIALLLATGLTVYGYWRKDNFEDFPLVDLVIPHREVIGFLPYWLINRADEDYPEITTLTYFSLAVEDDGTIQEYTKPGESEPGYFSLKSGKFDSFLTKAKARKLKLSLAVFGMDDEKIAKMLEEPEKSAQNLVSAVDPVMEKYGFTDLNLDIEKVSDASFEERAKYTLFVNKVRENLDKEKTLSIDVSASAFVKATNLCDPAGLAEWVDQMIIMAYDYHYTGSVVTGPVAPGEGAGVVSEFDTRAAVEAALKAVPAKKLVLGIPLYGYEWEAIDGMPRAAVIPGTGMTISNRRAEEFLAGCASCSAEFDETDKESHLIYKDQQTGVYHQFFYPVKKSTKYKVGLAKEKSLGGIAVWALGYEGETILGPLGGYRY